MNFDEYITDKYPVDTAHLKELYPDQELKEFYPSEYDIYQHFENELNALKIAKETEFKLSDKEKKVIKELANGACITPFYRAFIDKITKRLPVYKKGDLVWVRGDNEKVVVLSSGVNSLLAGGIFYTVRYKGDEMVVLPIILKPIQRIYACLS